MELHGHHHLLDAYWDVDMFVTLSWYFGGASSDPFSQTLIFRHLVAVMFFILRDVPYMFGFDLDHRDHMFDDKWFRVTWLLTYRTFDVILGHISILDETYRSWWSCALISICEMYAETMIYSLFFMMIPQWRLLGVIQLGSHFSTLWCHITFFPGDTSWIYGSDSVMDVDDWSHALDDRWFELIQFLDLLHIWCHTRAYSPLFGWDF